ncbi:MAG: Ig-like domain-containing protein [Deltaproteobacteria bacterium]|nr:Ig-like domain-containing protein [Deltaproteobacteria bacterium]
MATIDSNGQAIAVSIGTTTITATSGSISGSTTLTVNSATLLSLAVTPANPSILVGTTQQFTATGTYSDTTSFDITTQVTWSSLNPSVVTVNTTGLVTAVSAGSTTITATSESISGSTNLTVTPVPLVLISVTPKDPIIGVGAIQQFTATGTYADGTSHDITMQVTWSSSETSVATIDSNGLARAGHIVGRTTITAASGSISGSTQLTV